MVYRARQTGEDLGAYLKAKQANDTTGSSGINLGTTTTQPTVVQTKQQQIDSASKTASDLFSRIATEGVTQGGKQILAPTTPTSTNDITPDISAPVFKDPQAGIIKEQQATSIAANLEKTKLAAEAARTTEAARLQRERESAQAKSDALTAQQKDIIDKADPTKTQYYDQEQRVIQNKLDAAETASETLESNFAKNQKLTNELETLLTDIQLDVQTAKDMTGLASIRNPRIAQAAEEATARVGVIESVMAARNGQITVAHNMIDKAFVATTAVKNDQIDYYNTLLSFYGEQKTVEGNKILTLTKQEQDNINSEVTRLETEVASAETNANYIKSLMMDPDTAQLMADSGVTLNDTPEEVQEKFAAQGYKNEVINTSNKMAGDGYTYLAPGQTAPAGTTTMPTTDSKGNVKNWYKKDEVDDPTVRELNQSEIITIKNALESTIGEDGFVNSDEYRSQRINSTMNTNTFDDRFGQLLSPQERINVGIESEDTDSKWEQEGTVWAWLQSDEAQALSYDEITAQIAQFGLNPDIFGYGI